MNNSFFGKTMKNIRKRINVKLVTNRISARKQITKPTSVKRKIFSDDLMAIHLKKCQTEMRKPMYLGFSILELSKLVMYEFYYNILRPKFGDRIELLYQDTDSFVMNIQSNDLYAELDTIKEHFDFSNYGRF